MKHLLCSLCIFLAAVFVAPAVRAAGPMYPDVARAGADLDAALKVAAQTRRRVLVDFGGNWCGDCKVLDANLKKPEKAALVEANYVMVHVNVGDKGITDNFALAERYGIPLQKGVPALAILEGDGALVFSQKNGEFESMRKLDPRSVNDFLRQWRPK